MFDQTLRHIPRVLCGLLMGMAIHGVLPNHAVAQDGQAESGISYPLQVINIAGIERLQTKADAVFLNSDRPEMSDVMQNWIETTLRGLKGIDRKRPLGMMFFIKPGISPGLAPVSYFPISHQEDFLKFLAADAGTIKEVPGAEKRFDIMDTGWGPNLSVKISGGYAFMVQESVSSELDRRFPAPERLVSKLTNRYDIAYSILLKNIPPNTKKLFFELFKNQALAGLQQRDGEPETAYRVRRANGESLVDLLDMIVSQGEELTIGGFSNLEDRTGFAEIEINGSKDSGLAQFFQNLAGRRSYFAPAVNEASTLTINTSAQLDEKRRKPFVEAFTVATTGIADALKAAGKSEELANQAAPFFESLRNTAEDGRLDLFLQLAGTEVGDYRLIGGFRVLALGDFPQQLADFLKFGQTTAEAIPNSGRRAALEGLTLSESTIAGHPVHMLPLPTPRDAIGRNLFGEAPNLYLYATPQAFWFAVGQKTVKDTLTNYVTAIEKGPDPNEPARVAAPLLITTHASNWVTIGLGEGEAPGPDSFVATVVDAFKPGNDELRITGNPTDTGTRIRLDAKPGYVEWLGKAVVYQFDSSMKRAATREQRKRPAAKPMPVPQQ